MCDTTGRPKVCYRSHVVEIKTRVFSQAALEAACTRLGLAQPVQGTHELYGASAQGLAVRLPGWRYPAVFDTETGSCKTDTYHGSWGKQTHLDGFLQAYACEATKLAARRQGRSCSETVLADGSIRVSVAMEG
jgi:hypothetical protein